MKLIIAVAKDLFDFAVWGIRAVLSSLVQKGSQDDPVSNTTLHLGEPARMPEISERAVGVHDEVRSSAFDAPAGEPDWSFYTEDAEVPSHEKKHYDLPEHPPIRSQKNTVMYSAGIGVPLRSEPRVDIDNVYVTLPYGAMVMVLGVEDEWSRVLFEKQEGWVQSADLADRAAYVYPQFVIGEENGPDDPSTIRLRAIIEDEFNMGSGGKPLQAEEYVLYRLSRKGVKVQWPHVRPRTPGRWVEIFTRIPGAEVMPTPSDGSIMEVGAPFEGASGHLAYVEAVFPDGSIKVSEANWPEEGIYNERILVKDEWVDMGPMFIKLS